MITPILDPSIEHLSEHVNPPSEYQLPLIPETMIHHNVSPVNKRIIVPYGENSIPRSYGVSRSRRILTPGLFAKKYDLVRQFLYNTLELTTAQREVTLRLLRLWAYYGQVYAKESTITADPGCSKATYWRTIRRLRQLGLLDVINRFLLRPNAQISNLYKLDRLALVIGRYLAEHGVAFYQKWIQPYLSMAGDQFWPTMLAGDSG